MLLNRLLELPLRETVDGLHGSHHPGDAGQKLDGPAEIGIHEQVELHGPVPVKLSDQHARQRRFPRPHVPDDHVEPPAQADGDLQLLEAVHVLGGLEEELRLRGVGEGFPVEVEDLEVTHGCLPGVVPGVSFFAGAGASAGAFVAGAAAGSAWRAAWAFRMCGVMKMSTSSIVSARSSALNR